MTTKSPPTRPELPVAVGEWTLVALAALFAARSGAQPTGTAVVDPLYGAVAAGLVTYLAGRAGRPTVLWLCAVALVGSRGWLLIPALAAIGLAFASALQSRPLRILSMTAAATAVQVLLRWPHWGFQGATAIAGAAAVLPLLLHGAKTRWNPGWKGILVASGGLVVLAGVLLGPLALQVLRSRSAVSRAISVTDAALASVRAGNASQASADLAVATADFAGAHHRIDDWWTAGADLVPGVAQQRRALVTATSVAADVTQTVGAQASSIDVSDLHYRHGTVNLAQVEALDHPLAVVADHLARAQVRMAGVRSGWLLAPLSSRMGKLDREIATAQRSDSLAAEAVQSAPSLLGAGGTRHYLIALTDTSESRGLGGLLVWYGNLTVSEGRVTLSSYGDALKINDLLSARGGGRIVGQPEYLARYGQFDPQHFFIDATYSPDLPTVTDVVSQLYSQAGSPVIDGMLVLDPRSLAAVFQFTGPIYVPGFGTVDAGNARDLLERREYALYPDADQQVARKAALSVLMGAASTRLTAGGGPGVQALIKALGPDAKTGDLMFWSVHPEDQPLLERIGIAGKFPSAGGGDLLSVTTQNAGNNKIDAYLYRTIQAQVSYSPGSGEVSDLVTIDLSNSAPDHGLSYQVIGSYPGSGIPEGANETWVSVYSPLRLVAASLDGKALAITSKPELGVTANSAYVQVRAGATAVLVMQFQGRISTAGGYALTMYQQPMVNPDKVNVDVTNALGPGRGIEWTPPGDVDVFRFFPDKSLKG
ncbi:MAG TPA: DUF4012 domain-containing protein [Acidimicrobiales bacterium]|nr:DUF4012 domain-containing protein [Acidimicrobiales bacterium]